VLIHGLLGTLDDWQARIAPQLIDHFTVLTFDLRGHGESDMPPSGYTSADMARDLAALLDSLGIDQAHLAGHSFGGTVALSFTAENPDRVLGLTISDSRVRALQPVQKVKDWVHWPLWKAQLEKGGHTLDEESEFDIDLLETLRLKNPAPWQQGIRWERWERLLGSTTAKADLKDPAGLTIEVIRQIQTPTQAIYGELSFCLPSLEGLREHLPSLKATVFPNVGHRFPLTHPALFLEQVRAFHTSLVLSAEASLPVEQTPPTDDQSESH
jgi:pimeloyl-ACP methyl ester carboxylesterase